MCAGKEGGQTRLGETSLLSVLYPVEGPYISNSVGGSHVEAFLYCSHEHSSTHLH